MKLKLTNSIVKEYNIKKEEDRRTMVSNLYMLYVREYPLFINTLMTMADIEDVDEENKESLAYTYFNINDERLKIHINFEKIEKLNFNVTEIMFLILHEYLHNYFYHFERMKKESEEMPMLSNIVTDYYVNELLNLIMNNSNINLKEKGIDGIFQDTISEFAKEITGKSFPFNYENKPVENGMYKWFKDNMKEDIKNNMKKVVTFGNNGMPLDDHELSSKLFKEALNKLNKERKEKGQSTISEQMAKEIAKYKIDRISKNTLENFGSSESENLVLREMEKITVKRPFLNTLKLKRVIDAKLREHYIRTYRRMSRKRQNSDIVYKGKIKEYGNKVLVALDVSGSISDNDLKMFYELLNGYLSDKKKNIIDVIYWSSCEITDKNFHENIKDVNELRKIKIHSSGGTEVSYLHKFIKEHYKKQKINVINITDGYFWNFENDISDNVQDYYFLLTEEDMKEQIEKVYNKPNIKTIVIKDYK